MLLVDCINIILGCDREVQLLSRCYYLETLSKRSWDLPPHFLQLPMNYSLFKMKRFFEKRNYEDPFRSSIL